MVANSFWWPPGETSTIVVPGALLVSAASSELLTRTSPAASLAVGLRGDDGDAWYGLTSPLAGTVLATRATVFRPPTKEPPAPVLAAAGSTRLPRPPRRLRAAPPPVS